MVKATYSDGTTPKIGIIGAGISGLTAGIKLKTELGLSTFTIFEQNHDVGGTWLVNTYPGCACDVQSHLYSWSFEPNPNWSKNYASAWEILEYIKGVARKYELYPKIEFHSQVKTLAWDETIGKWRLDVYNTEKGYGQEYVFDIMLNGPGALRVPKIPAEFKPFKGPVLHSGAWDSSVKLENKIIAVIGSGSSAIQMIPELAAKAKELHCYQRKAAWVMPKTQFEFPALVKWLFATVPFLLLIFRWLIFWSNEVLYPAFRHGSWLSRATTSFARHHFKKQIPNDSSLRNGLSPNYAFGCKRVVVSSEYYPAMTLPHVQLHTDPILEVNEHGIVSANGGSQQIDVLVLGTGFTVQDYFAPLKITGTDQVDLLKAWQEDGPRGYLGISASNMPNCFALVGPNTGLGHSSVLFMIECQAGYIIQLIREMLRRDAKLIELKPSTEDAFEGALEQQMAKMVWGQGNCGSWYADARGVVTTIWPWTCLAYWIKTRAVDFSQYDFS